MEESEGKQTACQLFRWGRGGEEKGQRESTRFNTKRKSALREHDDEAHLVNGEVAKERETRTHAHGSLPA